MKKVLVFLLVNFYCFSAYSQELYIPRDIKKAYERGSRSLDGKPGHAYFQNRTDYIISAEFFPDSRILKGTEKITYQNNSEYQLKYLILRLYQNIFKSGGIRGREVDSSDLNQGVKIISFSVNGKKCDLDSGGCILRETQTNLWLPFDCPAKSSSIIEINWEFRMPSKPYDRFGAYNESTFYMGYWYPQISVFDDINGWDSFDFNGIAEFYNEYGDFDVNVTVPENFVVWGTGLLQNPEQVLSKKSFQKFHKALSGKDTVHLITKDDIENKRQITKEGKNTWHFMASNVNDFAFATSNNYLWDATSIVRPSGNILVQTVYNPDFQTFDKVLEIACWSINELEKNEVGIDFPYPSMTVFNGIGGMEYPMMVNDKDGDIVESIFVTTHEIAHTYFPFLVGTNQRRHGWVDEGLITMFGCEVHALRDQTMDLHKTFLEYYPYVAGTQLDLPQIANSILLFDDVFQYHEYMRSSLGFWTLKDIMGKETFLKCIKEFTVRWAGKHPTPWDFYYTCNNVTGEDYSWFFEAWFNKNGYTDLSVLSADSKDGVLLVTLENTGGIPFPSKLIVSYEDGSSEERIVNARLWKESKTSKLNFETEKKVVKVLLDTSGYPDCNVDNNSFTLN